MSKRVLYYKTFPLSRYRGSRDGRWYDGNPMKQQSETSLPACKGPIIRKLFARISPRYDLVNHVLSLSIDRIWRWKTARLFSSPSSSRVLDLFCGTGDLARALASRGADVVGADFCPEMIRLAQEKPGPGGPLRFVAADALRLPFPDREFDLVTAAFGVRNLEDLDRGLSEMIRVVRPGGRVGILEFSRPTTAWLRAVYGAYLRWIVPSVGGWVSGDPPSYRYLSGSIRTFPDQAGLEERLRSAGLTGVTHRNLSGGIAAIHMGRKI